MLFRVIAVMAVLGIVIFCVRDATFRVLLAPSSNDFVTYRAIEQLAGIVGLDFHFAPFHITLINTELASQFIVHMSTSLYIALLLALPYVMVEIYNYVSPALYENEKRYSVAVTVAIFVLFIIGVLMSYFILFPFALRFLGTYQVAAEVVNQINLSSYVSTFVTLTLLMGCVFQIPVVSFFLAKLGVLTAGFMRRYRKHALIVIVLISAIITPPDLFTCCLVMVPMYGLYEVSIAIVAIVNRSN